MWCFHEPELTIPLIPYPTCKLTSHFIYSDLPLIHCEICTAHVILLPKKKLSKDVGTAEHCPALGVHREMVPGLRQSKPAAWALWRKIHCDNCTAVTWDPFSSWLWLIIPIKTCRKINRDGQKQD